LIKVFQYQFSTVKTLISNLLGSAIPQPVWKQNPKTDSFYTIQPSLQARGRENREKRHMNCKIEWKDMQVKWTKKVLKTYLFSFRFSSFELPATAPVFDMFVLPFSPLTLQSEKQFICILTVHI